MRKVNIRGDDVVFYLCGVISTKPLKQKISITLDVDIVEQIKGLAEKCDRSVSQYINLILKAYLQSKQDSKKK